MGSGQHQLTDAEMLVKTSQGWVCAVFRNGKVCALALPSPSQAAALLACGRCRAGTPMPAAPAASAADQLAHDLQRYFRGEAVDFGRYPVDLSNLPGFVRRSLLAARGIPYGQVRTYGWVAARSGNAKAARAVGQAMSRNPVALLVPCHRVVGAGGRLTGFGGGLPMKRALLELEGVACYGALQRTSPERRTAPRSRDRVALPRPANPGRRGG